MWKNPCKKSFLKKPWQLQRTIWTLNCRRCVRTRTRRHRRIRCRDRAGSPSAPWKGVPAPSISSTAPSCRIGSPPPTSASSSIVSATTGTTSSSSSSSSVLFFHPPATLLPVPPPLVPLPAARIITLLPISPWEGAANATDTPPGTWISSYYYIHYSFIIWLFISFNSLLINCGLGSDLG